jgi:general secretion pathway protein B
MSYILEALRKSERERQQAQAPGMPALLHEARGIRQRPWLWVIATLLVTVNVGLLAYVWLQRQQPAPVAATPAQAQTAPPAVPVVIPTTPPLSRNVPLSPEESDPPPAEPVQHLPATERIAEPRQVLEAPPARTLPAVPAHNIRSAPKREEPHLEPAALETQPKTRQTAPPSDLKINVLAYSPDPAERFAIVNMHKYLAGDELPNGAVLQEIQADGLLLEQNGTTRLLPKP